MATTSLGWRGSIGEVEIARLMTLAGVESSVETLLDWVPSAVPGNRQVSIAPGTGYAAFIQATTTDPTVLSLPSPAQGQWHLIVCRRTWETKAVEFLALEGTFTDGSIPGEMPSTIPTNFKKTPGVQYDQRIAWVWVNSANTNVVVWDLRRIPQLAFPLPGSKNLGGKTRSAQANVNPGVTNTIDFITFSIDRPKLCLITWSGRWGALANAAHWSWFSVNDTEVPGTRIRTHNDGTAGRDPLEITNTSVFCFPAGENTLRYVLSNDSLSTSYVACNYTHLHVAEIL